MIAVIQRVSSASVSISGQMVGEIQRGFCVLLGIAVSDGPDDLDFISKKILGMRIFSDDEGKMNKNLAELDGNILLISQFTLIANTKKGNRPSFIEAARPEQAIPLYENMIEVLSEGLGKQIATGVFGADMQVTIANDGPVTIVLNSKNRG